MDRCGAPIMVVHATTRTNGAVARLVATALASTVVGLFAGLLVRAFGVLGVGVALAFGLLVPAVLTDLRTGRLPDHRVLASGAVASASAMICAVTHGWQPAGAAVTGAVAMALPLLGIHSARPDAMGFGDVKLALVLGLVLGIIEWRLAVLALLCAATLGLAVAVTRRTTAVTFGPALLGGAVVTTIAAAAAHLAERPLLGWQVMSWR